MTSLATVVSPVRAIQSADVLRVGGFVPFTTTDYPGQLAAVVFCQGCPWRCHYCHNPHLLPSEAAAGADRVGWSAVLDFLDTRRGLLDAVVFSGGEPTAQPELRRAMASVRERGFAVGMHTAGAYPRRLAELLALVDWVGFDVKAPVESYPIVTGVEGSGERALASLDALCASGVRFEVRTTVHPALTPPTALEALARTLAQRGIRRWVLQPFRATGCADEALVAVATVAIDPETLARLRAHVPDIAVR